MDTEEKKKDREIFDRNTIIQVVEEGMKSEYWKILKQVILQWKKEEQSYLDSFRNKKITSQNMDIYNRTSERLEYLEKFLTINEKIISHNNSIVEKLKSLMDKLLQRGNFAFLREGKENAAR